MSYSWVKFLHVASAIAFVAVHGASIVVLYAVRRERDRRRILATLDFSGRTATAMYVSLGAIVVTGVWLALLQTALLEERWFWMALVLLGATTGLMLVVAKPFTTRLRAACELRPSGVPRISDEELGEILHSPRVHQISAIGFFGLAGILYLMVFQPGLGTGSAAPPPVTTTSTIPGATTTTLSDQAALLARGREVFEVTVGCATCHGLDGLGGDFAPSIAGRTQDDIENALRFVAEMADVRLSPEDLVAVAAYVEQLPTG